MDDTLADFCSSIVFFSFHYDCAALLETLENRISLLLTESNSVSRSHEFFPRPLRARGLYQQLDSEEVRPGVSLSKLNARGTL